MKNGQHETRWVLLWIDKNLFPSIRAQTLSFWQKFKQPLKTGRLKFKPPLIDFVEFETGQIIVPQEFEFSREAMKLSEQLEVHIPTKVYERFASRNDLKQFIIQVTGELYYPLWAPEYIRCMCRFLLSLPGLPDDLKYELETKLQLPDQAIQHEFSSAMVEKGGYSFNRYFKWAKEKYPGIDEDFRHYIADQKPGFTAQIEGGKYCIAQFGVHPNKPELFVYFPFEAREALPPPNGHIHGKVIGIVSLNPSPPLPEIMPTVYLRAICLFGGTFV